MATSARAAPIAESPMPSRPKSMPPKELTAKANIFIAAAISIIAKPEATECFAFPAKFVNNDTSASSPPIPARPFPICPRSILPKSPHAEARTLIAPERIRTPVAAPTVFPLNFAVFRKTSTSANSPPTPARPTASPPKSMPDSFFAAPARMEIAADIAIMEA